MASTQVWRVQVNDALNALAEDYPAGSTFCQLPDRSQLGSGFQHVQCAAVRMSRAEAERRRSVQAPSPLPAVTIAESATNPRVM